VTFLPFIFIEYLLVHISEFAKPCVNSLKLKEIRAMYNSEDDN